MKEAMLNPSTGRMEYTNDQQLNLIETGQMGPPQRGIAGTDIEVVTGTVVANQIYPFTAAEDGYYTFRSGLNANSAYGLFNTNTKNDKDAIDIVRNTGTGQTICYSSQIPLRKGTTIYFSLFLGTDTTPKITASFIPALSIYGTRIEATEDNSNFIGPPDYANMETINRITANNGTWTVDRNGYVSCSVNMSTAGTVDFYVNGKAVSSFQGALSPANGAGQAQTFQVKKGDVVKITAGGTIFSIRCYFIPAVPLYLYTPGTVSENVVGAPDLRGNGTNIPIQSNLAMQVSYPVTISRTGYYLFIGTLGANSSVSITRNATDDDIQAIANLTNFGAVETSVYSQRVLLAAGSSVYVTLWRGTASVVKATYFPALPAIATVPTVNNLIPMGPPDDNNIESINRISTENGSWTADRDGYVKVAFSYSRTGTATVNFGAGITVDGYVRASMGTADPNATQNQWWTSTVPVAKGQVVSVLSQVNVVLTQITCYYIPPIASAPIYLQPNPALNYSLTEQDSNERWLNNEIVYFRTFKIASLPDTAGANVQALPVSVTGFTPSTRLIEQKGWCLLSTGEKVSIPHVSNVPQYNMGFFLSVAGVVNYSGKALTDVNLVLYYTK